MARNVVTLEWEGNHVTNPVTKFVLKLHKLGIVKLAGRYLPIRRCGDEEEVGGIAQVFGWKPITSFVAWLTDNDIKRRYQCDDYRIEVLPNGHMKATKV